MKFNSQNLLVMSLFFTQTTIAADYPFTLPDTISAEININTEKQEKYNNKLLGTNIFKFTYSNEKTLIRQFDPLTIRFPHGLWANWYDWHTDSTRQFGEDKVTFTNSLGETKSRTLDHLSSIKIFEQSGAKVGIEGLQVLNDERLAEQGERFDMVWTFNMSADGESGSSALDDGSPESVARYQDLITRGFDVTHIEMGNENFYPGQRSTIIPNVSDYIDRAKSMSKALKAINPNIKLSIPLLRKTNTANPNYNELLTADKNYFDAVTVHTYVGFDPDSNDDSDEAFKTALLARVHIANSVNNFSRQVAPNKPIWLSEWGVKSGGPNAASILGMADTYIFMSENQDIYERANWFSINGQLNSFLVWHQKEVQPGIFRPRIKEPLEKTLFGSAHEIIRSILQDSTLLESELTSVELELGVKAVSARAVIKDNKVTIFALNLTDKSAPFSFKIDNAAYSGNVSHHAMAFSTMDEERILSIDENPLSLIHEGTNAITLAPFSLNKIVLNDTNIIADIFDVSLASKSNDYSFNVGEQVTLQAAVETNSSEVGSVQFIKNDEVLATITQSPYIFNWTPSTPGMHEVSIKAVKKDNTEKTSVAKLFVLNGEALAFDVSLATPNTAEITVGETLSLNATATTNYGEITGVDFKVNGSVIHNSNTTPYAFAWQPTIAGAYTIDVLATKADGSTEQSNTIDITVNDVVTPSEPLEPTTPTEPTTPIEPTEPTTENPAQDNTSGNISDDSLGGSSDGSSGGSISIFMLLLVGLLRTIR